MKRLLLITVLFVCVGATCSGEDDTTSAGVVTGTDDQSVGDGDSTAAPSDEASSDGNSSGSGTDEGTVGDDDDAAAIVGNPDLDLEELAEVAPDAAEALDGIDDIVSIGACRSELVGLEMTYVPSLWECRVMDAPVGGMDGFTLFQPGTAGGLEITIGTPSPLGSPCELMQACDQVEPLDLGPIFSVEVFEIAGIPFVSGSHVNVEAELAVTKAGPLTDEDIDFLTEVLNAVVEL
ncbi:MAG: hypothetical protein AAGA65_20755 [Actinomycetota bacterium]